METSSLAAGLVSMNAAKTQTMVNVAVLKKQLEMQKSVLDILDPASSRPPAPQGLGRLVDKSV